MPTLVLISRRDLTERNASVTVGEFRWSGDHKRHLLQGRGLTVEEFNAWARSPDWDRALDRYGAHVRIELVEVADVTADGRNLKRDGKPS